MRAAIVIGLAACAEPHVTVRAPAPTITPAERVAMFKALERADEERLAVSRNHGPWEIAGARLLLADGTKVEMPEDLLPVVAPDSDTARAARASAEMGHRANTWMYIGIGTLVASIVGVAAIEFGDVGSGIPDEYVLGATLLANAIPVYAERHLRHEELQLRMQAFSTYTRDLGLRLDVCAHGLEIIACETMPAPPSTYPPASPYPPAPTSPPASKYPPPGSVQSVPAPSVPPPSAPAPSEQPPAAPP